MESLYADGSRVGIWRILGAFDEYGLKATFSSCGRAVASTPALAAAPQRAGTRSRRLAGAGGPMRGWRKRRTRSWCLHLQLAA
jgi:hypothetical protein